MYIYVYIIIHTYSKISVVISPRIKKYLDITKYLVRIDGFAIQVSMRVLAVIAILARALQPQRV